ncbi:MAG: hypothetical protein P4L43_18160 [Syntrophobacteraceae bacterium]|nr:hypothetical protein [Syntrophobacteraceae bacterium]
MGIKRFSKLIFLLAVAGFLGVLTARQARAVPSFARQTGQACSTCHTMFPELTPFGRTFKLTGYVLNKDGASHPSAPPVAAMVQLSLTHTRQAQAPGSLPDNGWSLHALSSENDVAGTPQAASLFYGGQIYGHWGALIQGTYSNTDNRSFLDMSDIRYANSTSFCGKNLIYGFTFNNNPTSEDVWNSTPAWSYPYGFSDVGPTPVTPVAAPLIFSLSSLVGGAGAYVYWNNWLYVETAVYRTSLDGITAPFGAGGHPLGAYTDGGIPYWRLALTHQYGPHSFEIGTYGLAARVYSSYPSPPADNYRDVAFDAQYQYIFGNQSFSAQTTWVHEDQDLTASVNSGIPSNLTNYLDTFKINGNYYYRTKHCGQLGGTLSYFSTTGSDDASLYSTAASPNGNPNSHGEILELDYMPPWHDYGPGGLGFAKFTLQYVIFNEFNGSSSGASANNTLYLLAWFMF